MTSFQFYYFALNYFPLRFINFFASFIVLLFQMRVSQVNSGQAAFSYFLILLWSFLLVFSFESLLFLSWSHVASSGLLKLTQVVSNCFPRFSYECFFFYHFALNYFSLSFVISSLFFIFGYSKSGLVKLIRFSVVFLCFFIELLFCFTKFFF
jgi:hypothetical protein